MFKYFLIFMFAVGMMGYSLDALAGTSPTPCNSENLECEVTIKCVCETLFSTRVVSCPTRDLPDPFQVDDDGPDGTLEVDCRDDIEALCDDLSIYCKRWEKPNCLVTLPVEVGCEDE